VEVTVNPWNTIEVLPAAAGKLFVSVTVKLVPSVTTSVGPGICIEGQNPIEVNAAGANVALLVPVPLHTTSESHWASSAAVELRKYSVPFAPVSKDATAKPALAQNPAVGEEGAKPFRTAKEEFERRNIESALVAAGGNQTRAAKILGMPLRTLTWKLKRFGM